VGSGVLVPSCVMCVSTAPSANWLCPCCMAAAARCSSHPQVCRRPSCSWQCRPAHSSSAGQPSIRQSSCAVVLLQQRQRGAWQDQGSRACQAATPARETRSCSAAIIVCGLCEQPWGSWACHWVCRAARPRQQREE
jgi:hypothetical protein